MSYGSSQGYLSSDVDLLFHLLVILYMWLCMAFLWDGLVFRMLMVKDLMWQVSFCHEGTDLWENVQIICLY